MASIGHRANFLSQERSHHGVTAHLEPQHYIIEHTKNMTLDRPKAPTCLWHMLCLPDDLYVGARRHDGHDLQADVFWSQIL